MAGGSGWGARRGVQEPDLRPARADELAACGAIWRVSINDYTDRLNQLPIPDDLTSVMALFTHIRSTDPERFVVAVRPDDVTAGGERIVGFAAAVVRGSMWFLSMLFVLPQEQGVGLGRMLLERVLPAPAAGLHLGTATDSAQPISNALYSLYGIIPRVPLLHLVGELRRPDALPELPAGIVATPFEAIETGTGGGGAGTGRMGQGGAAGLEAILGSLDRELLGFEHPEDHRNLRAGGRRGFLYRDPEGIVRGYGYTSEVGRAGPVAALGPGLIGPILGHLLRAVRPRGAFAVWVPGAATDAVTTLLGAGLRYEGFPVLLCWDRPLIDFDRYLPTSPGLL